MQLGHPPLAGRKTRCSCVPPPQIQFLNSRRDSSPPLLVRRGARAFISFSLARGSGAPERRWQQFWHLGRCRVPLLPGTRASRRSTVAILGPATVLLCRTGALFTLTVIQAAIGAALHPTGPSHSRRPPHRGRTMTKPPGTWLRATPAGATPGSIC